MSIREESLPKLTEESLDTSTPRLYPKRWYMFLLSPLCLCLFVALILRIWLIVRTHGMIDGDEALVGIQAERILQGDFPVYFYGIPYFGSLEAYLASILFAIFGASAWALRAEATLVSLVLVWLTWRLASELADAAQLPAYAKSYFTLIAGLVAAVPPLYDGIVELRTWGGYIETFVLMLLLLFSVFRLTRRWHEDASTRELLWRWAGIGFIIGLGLWIYPLIVSAIVTSAIWIVSDRIAESLKLRRELAEIPSRTTTAIVGSAQPLLLAAAAVPASIVGFIPAILWGATHSWANIRYIRYLGGSWTIQRFDTVQKVTNAYTNCVVPHVISGALSVENKTMATLHASLLIFTLFCIFASTILVVTSFIWHRPALLRARHLAGLPTLFGACAAIIYCTSSSSKWSLMGCNLDLTGRYATPLMLAFPFFFATIFTLAGIFIHEKRKKSRLQSADGADTPAQPISAAPISRLRFSVFAQLALFALLLVYLGAQAWTYGLSNADQTFQSPYCSLVPANYDPIIAYMQQQHIQYAWATNLLGHPIIFKTNSRIIVVDPLEIMNPPRAVNRIPTYTEAVKDAKRPSFLVFIHHGDVHPLLLRFLYARQVLYHAAFFPSEPGFDVLVVTPLSRTVSPLEIKNLEAFNCFAT